MATAYIVWDRKAREVAAPLRGVFLTQADADAVIVDFARKNGGHHKFIQNLERVSVNID